jgi:hypothetical protein
MSTLPPAASTPPPAAATPSPAAAAQPRDEKLSRAEQIDDLKEMICQTKPEHYTAISVLDPAIFIEKTVKKEGDKVEYKFRASFMLEVEIKGFDREYDELNSYDHRM